MSLAYHSNSDAGHALDIARTDAEPLVELRANPNAHHRGGGARRLFALGRQRGSHGRRRRCGVERRRELRRQRRSARRDPRRIDRARRCYCAAPRRFVAARRRIACARRWASARRRCAAGRCGSDAACVPSAWRASGNALLRSGRMHRRGLSVLHRLPSRGVRCERVLLRRRQRRRSREGRHVLGDGHVSLRRTRTRATIDAPSKEPLACMWARRMARSVAWSCSSPICSS